MVRRRQVRHLGPLGPAIGRRRRRLVRPQHVHAGLRAEQVPRRALRPPLQVRLQRPRPHLQGRQVGPGAPDRISTKRPAPNTSVSMGVHHDNFDMWNSKYQPRWNAVAHGAQEGHRRHLGDRRAQARPALRRQRAPLEQLQLVLHLSRRATRPARSPASPTTAQTPPSPTSITTSGCRRLRQDRQGHGPRRSGLAGSSNTSTASRTSSTSTSPTCSTPTAAFPSTNTACGLVAHHYNVSASAWRQSRGRLHQQVANDCATGHLRPRPRARHRRHASGPALADRHLHRQLALQAGHQVQDPQESHRHAGRHRQPQRQPAAELPAARTAASSTPKRLKSSRRSPNGWRSTAKASTPRGPGRSTAKAPPPRRPARRTARSSTPTSQKDLTAADIRFTTKRFHASMPSFRAGLRNDGSHLHPSARASPRDPRKDNQRNVTWTRPEPELYSGFQRTHRHPSH